MSDHDLDISMGASDGAEALIARAAAAETRAHRTLAVAIDDFFLPEAARLDERTRAALAGVLRGLVETIESEIRTTAARLLAARGDVRAAAALGDAGPVLGRLAEAGLLRDPELMAELVARVRQEAMGAALPMHAPDDPERPSLINRFVQHPDRMLATGAMAVLIAESRRRGSPEAGRSAQHDLPAELHHRLAWWIAAALRQGAVSAGGALDEALCEAAERCLAAYDEGDRLEAAALRFAAAIDAQGEEQAQLLVESLGDQRLVLFTALLAHALGVAYPTARELVLDPEADRLWLALRALDLDRVAIAQIGYALCEADPRRDLEAFADLLDSIAAVMSEAARAALLPLRLPADYRAALRALDRREGGR